MTTLVAQIDKLISNLNALKPALAVNDTKNVIKFEAILASSIEDIEPLKTVAKEPEMQNASNTPYWVNSNYEYDPSNPRKPNMRELMEALSGRDIDSLYLDRKVDAAYYSEKAHEMLYGVIGKNVDNRNWSEIMASENIAEAVYKETRQLYSPSIDIAAERDGNGEVTNEFAVIKSENGEVLRKLAGSETDIKNTMDLFGANHTDIPSDLDIKITTNNYDRTVIEILKNMSKYSSDEHFIEKLDKPT